MENHTDKKLETLNPYNLNPEWKPGRSIPGWVGVSWDLVILGVRHARMVNERSAKRTARFRVSGFYIPMQPIS